MEKDIKHKNIIKKMVDFTNTNSLNFLFLLVMGYITYQWLLPILCLQKDCFFSLSNIIWIFVTILYFLLIIKTLNWIKSDENLDREIKNLQKQKLGLEINKLK